MFHNILYALENYDFEIFFAAFFVIFLYTSVCIVQHIISDAKYGPGSESSYVYSVRWKGGLRLLWIIGIILLALTR